MTAMASYPPEEAPQGALPPERPSGDDLRTAPTRASAAWTSVAAGAFLILLMLVFVLQNSDSVPVSFLWVDGNVPLGAALLLASVIGALTVVLIGAGRLLQLRLVARRHRRSDHLG
jgi:lipopolysaccharide assembly protein A